jgi:hypothetical protein
MAELRGQLSTGAAWSGGHLALDAIVAFVDEELSSGAYRRALEHLSYCVECASEVVAQTQARVALRAASTPSLPSSLLHSLRNIPTEAELPEPPAGLAIGPDGEFVSMVRKPPRKSDHRRRALDRRMRLGAGAVVSGLALSAMVVAGHSATAPSPARLGGRLPHTVLDTRIRVSGAVLDTSRALPAPVPVPISGPIPVRNATAGFPSASAVPAHHVR